MDGLWELEPVLFDAHTGRRRHREPHHRWEHRYRRRCRTYGTVAVVVTFTADELYEVYGFLCWWCGRNATEIDHVVAVIDGGAHTLDNVRPSCHRCNADREAERRRRRCAAQVEGQLILLEVSSSAGTAPGARTATAGSSGKGSAPRPRPVCAPSR